MTDCLGFLSKNNYVQFIDPLFDMVVQASAKSVYVVLSLYDRCTTMYKWIGSK